MLFFAVMFSALAQTTPPAPDFSGTWVLNATKSTVPKDGTIKSQSITIENKKSAIIFHYKNRWQKIDRELRTRWEKARVGEDVVRSTEFQCELA
jgi:hypothetical protein